MAEVEGVSVASSEGCQQQEPEAGKSQAAAEPSWPPEEFASEIVRIRPPPQQSDGGKAPVATLEEEVVVEYLDHTLHLSTILEEDELAPLFDGAYWPGSMVWPVSLWTGDFLHRHYLLAPDHGDTRQQQPAEEEGSGGRAKRMVELGCGCGVPGMMAALQGWSVALTEQPELIRFIDMNIRHNFPPTPSTLPPPAQHNDGQQQPPSAAAASSSSSRRQEIFADSLFWSRENARKFMSQRPGWDRVDLVVCCDCIYEPFWGESWLWLLETVEEFVGEAGATGVVSVERRNADGVDKFLARAKQSAVVDVSTALQDPDKGWQLFVFTRKHDSHSQQPPQQEGAAPVEPK